MVKYFGEFAVNTIQECEPFLRRMMKDVYDELRENDYRNGVPEIARNAQIVETSKNLLWFVTFSIESISDCMPLSDYAKGTPSEKQLGTELYYGSEVVDEVVPGTIIRGFMCMKCAGTAFRGASANDIANQLIEYAKKAYSIYKDIKLIASGEVFFTPSGMGELRNIHPEPHPIAKLVKLFF